MRKLLNVLYVTKPESYIAKDGTNIVVLIENKECFRIPIHNIEGIVTFGYCGLSPGAIHLCMEAKVGVSFLSPSGKFLGRVEGPVKGNVLLRRAQYRLADNKEKSLAIAANIVSAKIYNSRQILQRQLRDYGENANLKTASALLERSQKNALNVESFNHLLGIEGDAANTYFGAFNELIQSADLSFENRNRRPPRDPVNAMLSFAYTLLGNEVKSALEVVGLDPYVGFYHTDRPGRASLAMDMMEELRSYISERHVLSLINRRQIKLNDFIFQGNESVILTENARKEFISSWQKRKQEIVTHPFLKEKIAIGLIPYVQAMLLARHLRGDLSDYPVFLFK